MFNLVSQLFWSVNLKSVSSWSYFFWDLHSITSFVSTYCPVLCWVSLVISVGNKLICSHIPRREIWLCLVRYGVFQVCWSWQRYCQSFDDVQSVWLVGWNSSVRLLHESCQVTLVFFFALRCYFPSIELKTLTMNTLHVTIYQAMINLLQMSLG